MLFWVNVFIGDEYRFWCWHGGSLPRSAILFRDETFLDSEGSGAAVVGIVRVVLVNDRMDHDGLFVDCERGVRWNCNPVVCVWSVRLDEMIFRKRELTSLES
jgi:hypothetical protein